MTDSDRKVLICKLTKERELVGRIMDFIPEEADANIKTLEGLIEADYQCEHDYGIKIGDLSMCLDCGKVLSEDKFKQLYEGNAHQNILNIRNRYLEMLLYLDSKTSLPVLSKVYQLKLIKPKEHK